MNGTVKMLTLSAIPFLYSESSYVEMSHLQIVGFSPFFLFSFSNTEKLTNYNINNTIRILVEDILKQACQDILPAVKFVPHLTKRSFAVLL